MRFRGVRPGPVRPGRRHRAGLDQGVLERHPPQEGALDAVGVLRDALEGGAVLELVQDVLIHAASARVHEDVEVLLKADDRDQVGGCF